MFQLHVSEYLRMEGYCKQIEIYFPHFIAINFTVLMFNPLINYFWTSMDSLGVTWHAFADAFVANIMKIHIQYQLDFTSVIVYDIIQTLGLMTWYLQLI